MGDVGSAFLGFILALVVYIAAAKGSLSWTSALVLHAAFIGDATWTLFARLGRGQKPHQAHRSHIYQKMVRKGHSHARVSSLYGAFNILWLLPVAYAYEQGLMHPLLAYALAYAPVFAMAYRNEAGIERAKA
jgi:Fuc2NAc and GlcNAc transferase